MASFDVVTLAVAVLAVGGLAAVLAEILVKSPRSLLEMMDDSRRFAEAPLAGVHAPAARRSSHTPAAAANSNQPRLAA
jgi:hypothetical protein